MKYYGKRYLYNFLKEHGYSVPKLKDMEYKYYRGSEWLKSELLVPFSAKAGIEVYVDSKQCDVFSVTLCELDISGCPREVEFTRYQNGSIRYQVKNGITIFMHGQSRVVEFV